jgi:hypothetical protein
MKSFNAGSAERRVRCAEAPPLENDRRGWNWFQISSETRR